METITITLDGVEVSGNAGITVLDLARESGVDIPTLCNDPYLNPFGACRLCIVEEERSKALLAACVTPIRAGMVINTRSPRVLERRKTIIQLMLASHPDSCFVCDKGNQCQLRSLAANMGIGLVNLQRIPQFDTIEDLNPFIERDLSKCVMCAKCIRADQELVVEGAIDYVNRGFVAKPATLSDQPLEKSECTFCGTCVAMCPTGALREKDSPYHGTTTSTVDTVCPFCGCGCNITLEVKDNRVVRVRPSASSPVSRGTLCVRGAYGYDFIHSPERLTTPLIKTDGSLKPVSWEEALERIADNFTRIKEKYGADSLAVLGSSRCTNEENYLLQRLARAVFGTNNIDNGSRLYNPASREGLGWSIGFPGTTSSLDELEKSDLIMVIGANPAISAPAVGYAIKRAVRYRGAKLLLIDILRTKLVPFARLWLRPRIATDAALIHGMSQVIIKEGLFDEEFVTRRTDNFTELEKSLKGYTPQYVEEVTSVPSHDVQVAARLFAGAERAAIVYGNGITQHLNSTESVAALANLAMLTGNTGYQRGGIFCLQRENNAQGACDMGSLPDFLPGYQSIDDADARQSFGQRWGATLPTSPGLTALEMIEQAKAGKLKAMLIAGENPVSSLPAPSMVRQALASLEFLAVTDMFLTDTAKLAAVVLPAASFAEKEGTFTNFEGRVQTVRQAIRPMGNSLPDYEILCKIAGKMGPHLAFSSPQQVRDEIEDLIPGYERLSTDFDAEDRAWADLENQPGTRRLYKGLSPRGFGRFSPAKAPLPTGVPGEGYPLTLIPGSILYHFGSGTRSLMASRLRKFSPCGWVEISRTDAEQLGFNDGDAVKVVSGAGEVTTVLKITETLPAGMLFMPISFPDSPVNQLFGMVLDPRTKTPLLKQCAVRLERIQKDG